MLIRLQNKKDIQYLVWAFKLLEENASAAPSSCDFSCFNHYENLDVVIIPTDIKDNEASCYDEIMMYQFMTWEDFGLHECENNKTNYLISPNEFYYKVRELYLKEPVNELHKIPIEVAKKMYLSTDKIIKEYILTIYPESELKDPPYFKYKTVKDIVGHDVNNDLITGPNFLTLLRNALNEEEKIDYLLGPIYLPIIKVVSTIDKNKYSPDKIIAKFSILKRVYYLVAGEDDEYIPVDGIFNINYKSQHKTGAVSLQASYLAFASPKIAAYAAKTFGKQIFEASMWTFTQNLPIKWLDND